LRLKTVIGHAAEDQQDGDFASVSRTGSKVSLQFSGGILMTWD